MNSKLLGLAVAALMLICPACNRPTATSGAERPLGEANQSQKFEYLVIYLEPGEVTDRLNQLGLKGWELVALHPLEGNAKASPFYFKRKLSNAEHDGRGDGDKPSN